MARTKIPLTERDVASIEMLAGRGFTITEIAKVLKMSKVTLERRIKDTDPALGAKDALDRGRLNAISEVAAVAYDMATNGSNGPMTQFWLQCKGGWKKAEALELTGKNGAPLEVSGPQIMVVIPDNARDKVISPVIPQLPKA